MAKLATDSAPVFAPVFPQAPRSYKSPMIAGRPAGAQTFENIGKFKSELITEAKAKLIGPAGQKLTRGEEKKLRGELSNLEFDLSKAKNPPTNIKARKDEPARVAKQKVLQGEVKRLEDNIARTERMLNDSQATREYNKAIIRLEEGKLTPELQQRLDDYINAPSTPETQSVFALSRMAENMRLQKGFRATELALQSYSKYSAKLIDSLDEAKDVAVKALDDEIAKTDPSNTAKLDDLTKVRNRLADEAVVDRAGIDSIFKQLTKENIDLDVAMLKANEEFRVQMDAPTLRYEDYIGPQRPKDAKARSTPMQRQELDDSGLGDAYDTDMALYNQLENKMAIDADGNIVDATAIMKELEDELDGLDSVMRCAIG